MENNNNNIDMDITEQVLEELENMERMVTNLNSTGAEPYWECKTCEIEYRPALVPGEENNHPRCPVCHQRPNLADISKR